MPRASLTTISRSEPRARPPVQLCEHHYCRCRRAAELAALCDRTGQVRYLVAAVQAHEERVPCRLSP